MRRLEDVSRRLQEARDKFSRSRPQANDMDVGLSDSVPFEQQF